MAIKLLADFVAEVRFAVDDPNQTRYSNDEYLVVLTDALRALIDRASVVNPNFLQYGMGESKDTNRAVTYEAVIGGVVTVPADAGTADVAVDDTLSTLLDATQEWVKDEWVGYTLTITAGTSNGDSFKITSNTAAVLTIGGQWTAALDGTSTYDIIAPDNVLYDNALAIPWVPGQYMDAVVRITVGTAVGQEKKITEIKGFQMTVESDWTTALVNADTYEIVAVQKDYELPLDFYRLTRVKVNGVDLDPPNDSGRKQVGSSVDPNVDPGYSLLSNMTTQQIRIENLGGGEMIEVFYIPEVGLLTSTQQIPMSDIFFRSMQYYTTMRLKGNNYEELRTDAQFLADADAAVVKFMTDINVKSNMEIRSHYQDWVD